MTLRRILSLGAPLLGAAAVGWLVQRWGYSVREQSREVARRPAAPDTPTPQGSGAPVQTEADGEGARFYRRYRVRVADSELSAESLFARIAEDVDAFVPDELARFERTRGTDGQIVPGDEFLVHIRAPWNGPVRVAEASATHFVLLTLEGHLEAGSIRFAARGARGGRLSFEIESWARSADAVVDLAYDTLGVAAEAQQATWTFFCKRVAEACGGQIVGEIEVLTERDADDEAAA